MEALSKEENAGILAMYLSGEAIPVIASRFGIHPSTVTRKARAAGVVRTVAEAQAVRAARESVGWNRVGKKGAVQSIKSGKWFSCDSAYEFVRMHQLDGDEDVVEWRRCEDRIAYEFAGKRLMYVPDIVVVRRSGETIVEEVKPLKMAGTPRNVAKFAAATDFYRRRGVTFMVVTEETIGWDAIRRYDGVPLSGTPDEVRMAKRRAAALKHLHSMSPERRAEYNRAAMVRESAKRARDRDAYNKKASEYRRMRKARMTPEELDAERKKQRERARSARASLSPAQIDARRLRDREAKRREHEIKKQRQAAAADSQNALF